jgi:hypothetical protein
VVDDLVEMVKQDFGIFGFSFCEYAILLSHLYDYVLFVLVAGESCIDFLYQF